MVEHTTTKIASAVKHYFVNIGATSRVEEMNKVLDEVKRTDDALYIGGYDTAKEHVLEGYDGYAKKIEEGRKAKNNLRQLCISCLLEMAEYLRENGR